MAEAIKKKKNDISGNTPVNSAHSSQLVSVVAACNIFLGNSPSNIASVISSFQANELARAALQAAKKRVTNQTNADKIESAGVGGDCSDVSTASVEVERLPRKPLRRGRSQSRKRDDAGVNHDTK
jgi:2-iminoacetate synthase ThiH